MAEEISKKEEAAHQPPPNKTEEKKAEQAKPQKAERPANCPVCNKSIKKKWYYRNGAYYCGKGCWKQAIKKAEQKQNKSNEKEKKESKESAK